jgi:DNA primase
MPLSELLVSELTERFGVATPEGRAHFLADAAPLLNALAAPALRLQLVHRVAGVAQLSVEEVEGYLASVAERQRPHGPSQAGPASGSGGGEPAARATYAEAPGERRGWQSPSGAPGQRARRDDWPGARQRPLARAPAVRPDLEGRIRLLLALHPGLAHSVTEADWMPQPLARWVALVAGLPAGSAASNVVEALRDQDPDTVRAFERALASDAAALADLSAAEAASELAAALEQLRQRHVRRQIDALVAAGIRSDEDRERYHALMAMRSRD